MTLDLLQSSFRLQFQPGQHHAVKLIASIITWLSFEQSAAAKVLNKPNQIFANWEHEKNLTILKLQYYICDHLGAADLSCEHSLDTACQRHHKVIMLRAPK